METTMAIHETKLLVLDLFKIFFVFPMTSFVGLGYTYSAFKGNDSLMFYVGVVLVIAGTFHGGKAAMKWAK